MQSIGLSNSERGENNFKNNCAAYIEDNQFRTEQEHGEIQGISKKKKWN